MSVYCLMNPIFNNIIQVTYLNGTRLNAVPINLISNQTTSACYSLIDFMVYRYLLRLHNNRKVEDV